MLKRSLITVWTAPLRLPKDVLAVMTITVASSFGNGAIAPLLGEISNEFNISFTALGALISGFAIARLVIDLPAGGLIDRIRVHTMFYTGGMLAIAGVVVTALAPIYPLLFAGRFIEGSGSGVASAAAQAYVARRAPEHERGRMLGSISAATMLGGFLSPAIVGVVASFAGWRFGLLATVLPTLVALGLVTLYVKHRPKAAHPTSNSHKLHTLVYTPGRLIFINLMTITLALSIFGFKAVYYPVYGTQALGLEPALVGIAISISTLMRFPIAIAAGTLSDKFGRVRVYVPSALFMGLVSVLVSLSENATTYVLFGLAFGLGGGAVPMVTSMVVDRTPRERLGVALGTHAFLRDIGVAATPLLLGLAIDGVGYRASALGLLAFAILSAGLAIAIGDVSPRHRDPAVKTASSRSNGPSVSG